MDSNSTFSDLKNIIKQKLNIDPAVVKIFSDQ